MKKSWLLFVLLIAAGWILFASATLALVPRERDGDAPPSGRCSDSTASDYYRAALAMKPKTAAEWLARVRLLEKSMALDGSHAPVLAALGYGYVQYAGKIEDGRSYYELAENVLRRALAVDPHIPEAIHALGSLCAKIGKSEEAAALLRRGLRAHPNDAELWLSLGYVYRYAGLMDESIAAYQRAQEIDSGLANLIGAQSQITKSLIYQRDDHAAAASHAKMRRGLAAMGKTADEKQHFYGGVIYLYSGRREAALAQFDSAFAVDSTSVWSWFGLAYKAAVRQDRARVPAIVSKLEAQNIVDGERAYRLVHFQALTGETEAALRNLQKAIAAGFFNSSACSACLRGALIPSAKRRLSLSPSASPFTAAPACATGQR